MDIYSRKTSAFWNGLSFNKVYKMPPVWQVADRKISRIVFKLQTVASEENSVTEITCIHSGEIIINDFIITLLL
jgi:hypothetical protein